MADSKELQTQLQINQQINKVLADRSKQLDAMQQQLTSQTQLAAELCKAMECKDLDGLQDRINGLNDSFKAAADGAQELGSAQAQASKEMSDGLESNREKAGGFLDRLSTMKTAAVAGGAGFLKAFSGVGGMFKMISGGVMAVVGNLFSVGKAIFAVPFQLLGGLVDMAASGSGGTDQLREAMEDLKETMGDLSTGAGAAVMDSFDQIRSSGGALAQTGLSMTKVFGPGKEGAAAALKALGEVAAAAGSNLDMIAGQMREAGDAALMMNKGLGMSNEALAEMMRKAQNSGTSAREEMVEMGSMAIQMGDKFGVSAKSIGKNVSKLIESVEDFGGMSKKQLTATATYMAKLGLEAKDLQGVIGKFDDFESAAEGVSQLNQAFGIQLDTMEMMNAQNPAERIDMMRDAFHSAGKSVEDMTRAEKKLMAEQMGLSVSAMENALATENMGVSYEDMEGAAEEAEANKMSEKEVMLELAKSIKTLTQSGSGVSGFFDAFKKGFGQGFAQAKGFRELMQSIRKSLKVVFNFGKKFGKMVGDLFGKLGLFKSLKKIFDPAVFEKFFGKALGYFQKFFDAITGKGDYSAAQLLEDLTSEFSNTFGKAGGEAASSFKTFFIKMIEIAGDVIASALPWLIEKFANIIQGIADFIANPKPAMDAVGQATDGIGGAFANALSKIGKALMPVLPKLGKALKDLFGNLFTLITPFLIKGFIALIALSAAKGIAVGLIKGAGTAIIMTAIKFLAKKMGITMAASSAKELKKGAKKGSKAGTFKSMGQTIKAIGKINKKDIGRATITLGALALMFTVGMVAFAAGVFLAYQFLKKVTWGGFAKVIAVTLVGMIGTYAVAKFASKMNPAALLKAIPGLLAAAGLFAVGMVAFAGAVWLANKILQKVPWEDATKAIKIVGLAILATAGMALAGAGFFAMAAGIPFMIAGLVAGAALFVSGVFVFGKALEKTLPQLQKFASNEGVIKTSLGSISTIIKTVGKMGALGSVFAAIGLFVGILKSGFETAADFFVDILGDVKRMIDAMMKIPMANPDDVGKRIFIISKIAEAMQAISKIGLDAAKMGMVSELLGGTSMPEMMKSMGGFIKDVAGSLATLIALIVGLASGLDPKQSKNVEIVSTAIEAIAALASALFKPLEVVGKLSSDMFGPKVTDVMDAVVKGLESLMAKVETLLPSLVKKIIAIAKDVKDPKSLKPKMEMVSAALGAVADFSSAIGTVAKLIPSGSTAWYKKDKDMGERLKEMGEMIKSIVSSVQTHIQPLVKSLTTIDLGGTAEEVGPKIKVISDVMAAIGSFATVVEKISGLKGGAENAGSVISGVTAGLNTAIGDSSNANSISGLFQTLSTFEPDAAQLTKLDTVIDTMHKLTTFAQSAAKLSESGGAVQQIGTAVTAIVEQAKQAITALNSIGELNASVALDNFAQAIGTGDGQFTITNEPINITMNVQVTMDAGKISNVLVDKTQMTAANGTTLAPAE